MNDSALPDPTTEAGLRAEAVARLKAKRELQFGALWWLVINAMLVFIWWRNGGGFPWPLFSIVFWGAALLGRYWSIYHRPDDEAKVQAEMQRLREGH